MFLLLTDYHSTKKVLINLDDVRRVDVFQEAFARLTFSDIEIFDTSESFDWVCQQIMHSQPVPEYITGVNEYASPLFSLPQTFPPPDINDIPKRD